MDYNGEWGDVGRILVVRLRRTWRALLLAGGFCLALPLNAQAQPLPSATQPAVSPPAPSPSPPPAPAQPDEAAYGQHMDNGVKLYREGNYDAAIAEFEAAYHYRPNASPLINLANCYKKQAEYAKAIAVLERAIAEHADTMKTEHREIVEREIREMRALLAFVAVTVVPGDARLLVDGRPVSVEERGKPLALSPGQHSIKVQADGYKTVETVVKLVSGNTNQTVSIKLEAIMGSVSVTSVSPLAQIAVDGSVVGTGSYLGMLPPGIHQLTVVNQGKEHSIRVLVKVGAVARVEQTEDGSLESTALAPEPEQVDDINHFFVLAQLALLTSTALPNDFSVIPEKRWGFGAGGNAGYMINRWLGFELMGQYSDIRVRGTYPSHITAGELIEGSYHLQSFRGAAMLRLNAPGAGMVRFAGAIGGGITIERLQWDWGDGVDANPAPTLFDGSGGFSAFPYGQLDLGVEFEFSNVLAAFVVQQSLQSTKHLADSLTDNPFDERANLILGAALRAGYAF